MKTCLLSFILMGFTYVSAQVNFQVRQLAFEKGDSIVQLMDHPNGNEVLRIFANPSPTSANRTFRGLIRERGDRVDLPLGEYVFCMDGSELITESLSQSRQRAQVKSLRMKRYQINKTRLSMIDSRVDSLEGATAPLWRRWNGKFLVNEACPNVDTYKGTTLLALRRDDRIEVQVYKAKAQLPVYSGEVTIDQQGRFAGGPWLQSHILSPDVWMLASYWYGVDGKAKPWYAALDTTGKMLWQRAGWDRLVDRFNPLGMILGLRDDRLLGLQLDAINSRDGQTIWTTPLYELYNNDERNALASFDPKDVKTLDIAPVLGGAYTAVLMQHDDGASGGLLLLLDDQGKQVYRYPMEGPLRLARLQDRDTGFALVTEAGSWLFRPL